ncbi:MAG: hypothetical protein PHT04_06580, partial [Eubacteriales bacterium]|nr:hypothetical protein [Eubacteriales bacterium]
MSEPSDQRKLKKLIHFAAAAAVYIVFIVFVVIRVSSNNFSLSRIFHYRQLLLQGLLNTLIISAYSLLFGLVLGFILYLARESKIYFFRSMSNIFI